MSEHEELRQLAEEYGGTAGLLFEAVGVPYQDLLLRSWGGPRMTWPADLQDRGFELRGECHSYGEGDWASAVAFTGKLLLAIPLADSYPQVRIYELVGGQLLMATLVTTPRACIRAQIGAACEISITSPVIWGEVEVRYLKELITELRRSMLEGSSENDW